MGDWCYKMGKSGRKWEKSRARVRGLKCDNCHASFSLQEKKVIYIIY